ncbi:abhydrolase domain-containing protein 16a-like protein [Dermatophagoides farinae]|uniref:Abhydrolase domain-containing protein 16a-like protein n=1 Tax=Dermatophagoides farinae TaxID=6954 RepID=A0A9D4NRH2_DERFA|nr:phosphatidylserine lipase ABHD16A-like isoform X2 [Dermatophagoides farinae]XP_046917883.1 phosphatidylserine lipase ABHD16A-like isoform X2 [Dermatophagoides farinae]KAH7636455.1 abhydrolase domain-containing protein 16a-like protein [Dermatophagoides farinae]
MSLFDCIFGPALYRIFENPHRNYEPYNLERYTDRIIRFIQFCKNTLTYVSPLLAYQLYCQTRDTEQSESSSSSSSSSLLSLLSNSTYVRLLMAFTSIYILANLLRGFSRSINPNYCQFIRTFKTASTSLLADHRGDDDGDIRKRIIDARNIVREKYDYDFQHWPIDFKWTEGRYCYERPAKLLPIKEASNETLNESPVVNMVSYLMANSIGRILLYPGSIGLLQKVIENNLITGRHFLMENYQAKRFKLLARDQNQIDVIFVDKRNPNNNRTYPGNTLVITCEGNAGFYEIGSVTTPINLNYSVIGWNHPGFGGSTGTPFPQNDINAMEVVVNFAVTKLNFKLEDILIFGWSIGGFPAAWAVSNYPELKGVILDASFDDVLPLARSRMMPFLAPIVDSTIRNYFNLNVSSYLNRYQGPIRFIRRLKDEIIPIDASRPLLTNRGNHLLIKLLKSRFPRLMSHDDISDEVEQFLHSENYGYLLRKVDDSKVMEALSRYAQKSAMEKYPIEIDVDKDLEISMLLGQQIILFLCRELMTQFDSTHCTPLPSSLFKEPVDLLSLIKKA